MNASQTSSRTGFWVAIAILSLFLMFSLASNAVLIIGLALISGDFHLCSQAEDEFPQLEEIWSYGHGNVKAARIPVTGIITREGPSSFFDVADYDAVETVLRQIRAAGNDTRVKAIIIEVDSPGGDITATDEIHHALCDFKQSADDRKVVAFVKDLAASGGYYVATASDWIIAEPTAIVGSIAAIIQTLNWKELSDKIGVHDVTIKSGDNKDLLNPFRDVNPDQLALLQEVVDAMHDRFFQVVEAGRCIDPEFLQEVADGRVFTIDRALEYNLVDQQGYWKDVVDKTGELLGETSVKIVKYEEKPGFSRLFSQIGSSVSLTPWLDSQRPRLMYLWRP